MTTTTAIRDAVIGDHEYQLVSVDRETLTEFQIHISASTDPDTLAEFPPPLFGAITPTGEQGWAVKTFPPTKLPPNATLPLSIPDLLAVTYPNPEDPYTQTATTPKMAIDLIIAAWDKYVARLHRGEGKPAAKERNAEITRALEAFRTR